MNFKYFVLCAFLGLVGLALIAALSHMSGDAIDPEYLFEGEIVRDFDSAEDLVETFKKDRTEADTKYIGKGIRVKGEIFDKDINPLKLITADGNVLCYFPKKKHPEIFMAIQSQTFVTVTGRCKSADKAGLNIVMDGCRLDMPQHPKMPFGHPDM